MTVSFSFVTMILHGGSCPRLWWRCEKSFGPISSNHGKKQLGQAFFFFILSSSTMSMYEYDFNFLDVFLFLWSQESRGYPKDRRSKGFLDRRRIFPGNGFFFMEVMYISFPFHIPMIVWVVRLSAPDRRQKQIILMNETQMIWDRSSSQIVTVKLAGRTRHHRPESLHIGKFEDCLPRWLQRMCDESPFRATNCVMFTAGHRRHLGIAASNYH